MKNTNLKTSKTATPSDDSIVVARPFVRLMSLLYDGMLILAMLFLTGALLAILGTLLLADVGTTSQDAQTLPQWYQRGVMTPAFVLTLIGFYGVFWRKSGQTLGMQTWRLKTVDAHGNLLTWRQSIRRIISACFVPALFAVIAVVVSMPKMLVGLSAFAGLVCNYMFGLLNRRGLAIHDILSDTMTLKIPKFEHQGIFAGLKNKIKSK